MRAVVVDRWLEPGELTVSELPDPEAGPGRLLVEVDAAGCNFFDILMVQGKYQVKPGFPFVPGAEVAGVVREVGPGVDGFEVGDRVFASAGLGGFAELAAVPARSTWRLPEGMSFAEGAALVHAAAGGVGIAAVQIGKALGARVIATAGGAEKLDVARKAGADVVIDYREDDFVEAVKQATDGRGADVIYDSVGGDVFDRSLKCIAWNGRLLVIGFAGGRIPEVKANRILLKNIAVVGLHWGAHAQHQPELIDEVFERLFELYEAGGVRPVIYGTYPLERVAEALCDLASRRTWGKVIVSPRA
jgi:NADPH2:quinone reductase